MEIQLIIDQITTTECVNCKFGKCLIALKALRDDQGGAKVEVAVIPPAANSRTPKRLDGRSKKRLASTPGEKICKGCQKSLSLDRFPIAKNCKDGHEGKCRECRNNENKLRRAGSSAAPGVPLENPAPSDDGLYHCPDKKCGKVFRNLLNMQEHAAKHANPV
jgi:hypothetical protein